MKHRFSKITLAAGIIFLLMFAAALFFFYLGKGNIETGRMLASIATFGLYACLICEGARLLLSKKVVHRSPTSAR